MRITPSTRNAALVENRSGKKNGAEVFCECAKRLTLNHIPNESRRQTYRKPQRAVLTPINMTAAELPTVHHKLYGVTSPDGAVLNVCVCVCVCVWKYGSEHQSSWTAVVNLRLQPFNVRIGQATNSIQYYIVKWTAQPSAFSDLCFIAAVRIADPCPLAVCRTLYLLPVDPSK